MDRIELDHKYSKLAWKKNQHVARMNAYIQFTRHLRNGTNIEALKEILASEIRGRKAMLKRDIDEEYKDYCTVKASALKRVLKELD